jgi:signal transduction histidine kinase
MLNKIEEKQKDLLDFVEMQKNLSLDLSIQIKNKMKIEIDSLANMQFFYFTEDDLKKHHSDWDYLNELTSYISTLQKTGINHFISIDQPIIYSVVYIVIEENFKQNLLVSISSLNKSYLGNYDNIYYIDLNTFNEKDYPSWVKTYLKGINITSSTNILFSYQKTGSDKYQYFTLLYDARKNSVVMVANDYLSDISMFFTRTWILMTLLLLISLLILIFTFGKWFSMQMIKPIKELAKHMHLVAENPTDITEYTYDEKNELQIIINIYNQMVQSLQEYQYSLLQYKTLFDKAQLAFFWLDKDLQIKLYNPEFMSIFELVEDPENENIIDITPLRKSLFKDEDEYTFTDLEMWLESLNKYISITLQKQEINNQVAYIGIIGDITNQRQLQESKKSLEMELIRTNRLAELGKRIQGIVHNLNSPLNSILGFAQFAQEDMPDNTDIDKIISSAKTMSRSIKLLLSKIKKDSMASPDLVDINDFIELELENYKHHLFFKNEVTLNTTLAENMPSFLCTYGDLSQVFNIIFNNAIDAMETSVKKELSVSSFIEDDGLGFIICDSGSGIKKEYLDKIFDVNFSTKTLSASGGFGLGLALAKAILNKMNGKIEIQTELGVGTCFKVKFPIL